MDEYITRDEFIEAVKDIPMWGSVAAMFADGIPAADVAPVVHARWIYVEETLATSSGYCCSACRRPRWLSPDVPEVFKYCPNCGAMMDGGADHEAD